MDDQTPFKMPPFTGPQHSHLLRWHRSGHRSLPREPALRITRHQNAAAAACTRALEAGRLNRTDRVRAYNSRGILWKRKGEYDRAIADYTAAIELNRSYLFAYYNRGNSYFETQNFDRAISDYTAAIRINPKYPQAYANRGAAYGEKHDYDRALADYNVAIQLDPKYAAAYNNRGVAWKNKGEYDLAIQGGP